MNICPAAGVPAGIMIAAQCSWWKQELINISRGSSLVLPLLIKPLTFLYYVQLAWRILCSCGGMKEDQIQILVIQQLFLGIEQQQFCCWSISVTRKGRRMKENAFLSETKRDIYDVCTSGASWCSRQNPPQPSALIRRASLMTQSVKKKRPALGFKGRFVGSVSTRCGVFYQNVSALHPDGSSSPFLFIVSTLRMNLSVVSNGSSPNKTNVLKAWMREVIHHRMKATLHSCTVSF